MGVLRNQKRRKRTNENDDYADDTWMAMTLGPCQRCLLHRDEHVLQVLHHNAMI